MNKLVTALFLSAFLSVSVLAQQTSGSATPSTKDSSQTEMSAKKKRPPIFRATKDQIMQAQTILKERKFYSGEQTGKLDDSTREALKKYQEAEGVKSTGTLNRITLEKMKIELSEKQLAIPVPEMKAEKSEDKADSMEKKPRKAVFRATKDQITQAQTILKQRNFYSGEATGKLDDPTREALKKYQEAEKIKVTGTLNRETLEQMSVLLTEKQKAL